MPLFYSSSLKRLFKVASASSTLPLALACHCSCYGQAMVMCERMPEIFSAAMGNQMYTVKLDRFEDVQAFIAFVHAKQRE